MPRKFTFTTQVYDKKTDFPQTGDVDVIYIDASKNIAYRYDDSYYTISSAEVDIWGAMGSLSKGGGGGGGASWGSINGTLSNQTDLNTALSAKQNSLTLTTTGTSGAATLSGATLNIPQYSGGGASGIHAFLRPQTGDSVSFSINATALSSSATTNNRLTATPFIPARTIICSSLYINCATLSVGALGRILIYSDLNGLPNTKLYESATLDLSTTGIKTATTTFTFNAGTTYWMSYNAFGTATISTILAASLIPLRTNGISTSTMYISTSSIPIGSAPSPFGPVGATNVQVPFIGITIA
jgi:hypothetical protein